MVMNRGWLPVLLSLFPVHAFNQAPTVQDCLGAIPVCEPVYYTTNSYTGHGNVYPEIHDNGVCPLCMDGEKNDVFYIITVQTSGILRFTLTPNNPSNDYDWSLFNMTNADCDDIYTNATALQVSCNSYGILLGTNGPTGINTALGNQLNCNGPGNQNGPPFNKDLAVFSGETYVLNISNWSSTNQSGYTLDFSASTATIFDNVPPVIDSVQETTPCSGTSELYFRFSENVRCDDLYQHPEKLSLTGPGGPYTLTAVGSGDCATGAAQSPSYTLTVTPALMAGSYTLSIVGDIHDLCDNLAVYQGYPFTLSETNAPWAGAGNDTTIANGVSITLHGSAGGGAGNYSYSWEPASLLVNPEVQNPVTVSMGASTLFTLTVTDNAGCHGIDDVLVTVIGGPLGASASADPGVVCHGNSSTLHVIASGGSGNFTYSWTSDPPGFISTLPDPVVVPAVSTTYFVTVNDGFSTASSSTTITVNAKPNASAGNGFSIPYGTNAVLSGSGSGGSGTYSYLWSSDPPGYSGSVASPTFYNLQQTTIFYLVVADAATGCQSDPDPVVITVTGSPLSCSPIALPPVVCKGDTAQLFTLAGGGSGNYTFQWSSNPPGFTSTVPTPLVSPETATMYQVEVSDGFNITQGEVSVQVNPVPVIHLGPADSLVCVYDTLRLDAGNEGSEFLWSNGATSRSILVASTGIGYELQHYEVRVTNGFACRDSSSINIIFSFDGCTGLDERISSPCFTVYPNPSSGAVTILSTRPLEEADITVLALTGQMVQREYLTTGKSATFVHLLDLSSLPSGIYLIRVCSRETTGVVKFVIQQEK